MRQHKRMEDRCCAVILGGILMCAAALLVLPLVVTVAMSFDGAGYLTRFPPHELSVRWYNSLFSDPYYRTGLLTSIELAGTAMSISVVAGMMVAVGLDRFEFPGKTLLSVAFMSPIFVGGVVVGFSLLVFFSRLGVDSGFVRLLAGHVIVTLPYTIRSSLAALSGINPTLEQAALSLGASEPKAFFDVALPLARPGVIAGAVFAFAFSMDEVSVSMFLTTVKTYTLPVALISMMRSNFNLTIAAAAVLLLGLTILVIVVLDRMLGLDRLIGRGSYGL